MLDVVLILCSKNICDSIKNDILSHLPPATPP